jgi:hypothetical protein
MIFLILLLQVSSATPPVQSSVEQVIQMLGGSLSQKRAAVALVASRQDLREQARVHQILLAEFHAAVERDRGAARSDETSVKWGFRGGSDQRDYLGDVMNLVVEINGTEILPDLARADLPRRSGALDRFGNEAITPIIQAWDSPLPIGYSRQFKTELLQALLLIVSRSAELSQWPQRMPESRQRELVPILAAAIRNPSVIEETVTALRVAELLDDERLLSMIRPIVDDPAISVRLARGDLDAAAKIREAARRVVKRRGTIF